MASHHHCRHHQQHSSTAYPCCCSCPPPPLPPHQFHSPQQLSPTDPLIQAIATQLQQQQLYTHHYLNKPPHQKHKKQQVQPQPQPQSEAIIASLVRRIEALETSFHHHISPSPSPALSLRDIAARTIQTHFRAYLVRRSRTLRHLKHLAIIKSSFNSLKSSISDTKPHFDYQALSQKSMDLLLKLDFIQGGDPMIRDGKRSISRELVKFLEFIDGVSSKRRELYWKAAKKVRFVEDNEKSRVYKGAHEPYDVEELDDQQGNSSDDQREVIEKLCKKVENIEGFSMVYEDDEEEEVQVGVEEPSSNLMNNLKKKCSYENGGHFQGQNGNSLFSAPMPVQMESIRDEREKIVRVAG